MCVTIALHICHADADDDVDDADDAVDDVDDDVDDDDTWIKKSLELMKVPKNRWKSH